MRLLLSLVGVAMATVTEYVGMAPSNTVMASNGGAYLTWAKLSYQPDVSAAADVVFEHVNATNEQIGSWFNLDLSKGGGNGLALAGKVLGDNLYTFVDKAATTGAGGGCCADTLRTYDRTNGKFTELDLNTILAGIFPSTVKFHHASHTFDIEEEGGVVYAYLMVQYTEMALGGALANAVVAISTIDGTVKKTADGESYFSFFTHAGTTNTTESATVFKVQYYNTGGSATEEWHGNGVLAFSTNAGEKLLAFTHRFDAEAVILTDPYSVKVADGGGAIRQRFGTPKYFKGDKSGKVTYHHFGGMKGDWTGGVHNVYYSNVSQTAAVKGLETLTLFVNSMADETGSFVYEFALNLTKEVAGVPADDSAFDTKYAFAHCGFTAQAQGGARTIGDGVFIVASGLGSSGMMEVVDVKGGKQDLKYVAPGTSDADDDEAGGMVSNYDPYIRVVQ